MKLFGIELSQVPRKYKIATFVLGFIIIVPTLAYTGVRASNSPKLCQLCHVMKPEYFTWQASSHKKVSCVQCHEEPGIKNYFKSKVNGAKKIYAFLKEDYLLPISMEFPIKNRVCLKCHTFNREVTSGDLIVPHEAHDKKSVNCTTCHQGVAHGRISERELNEKADIVTFTATTGKRVMGDRRYRTVFMEACMDCHKSRGGPSACEACHTQSKVPDFHRLKTFETKHADWGRQNLKSCLKCHGYEGLTGEYGAMNPLKNLYPKDDLNYAIIAKNPEAKPQYSPPEDMLSPFTLGTRPQNDSNLAEYARQNEFCVNCHKKLPVTHKVQLWREIHGKSKDSNRCLTCHANYQGQPSVAATYCNYCHYQPHIKGWDKLHPYPLPPGTKPNNTCMDCHVEDKCKSCHLIRKVKVPKAQGSKYALMDPSQQKSLVPDYILKGYKPSD